MAINKSTRQFDIAKFLLTLPGILIVYTVIFSAFFIIKQNGGNNPILFQIGNTLTFRWYGVLITLGVVAALFLSQYLSERRGEDPNHVWGLLPILLVFGILFARLWYVINTWEKYKEHLFSFGDPNFPGFFEVWRGGIAIQGAVVGGIIGLLIYRYFTKIKFLRWADFIIPGLIVAQSLGRWGNFFNNEAYGGKTDLPWGIKIPCIYRTTGGTPGTENTTCPPPDGTGVLSADTTFHPTFFYESIWNYAVFITLLYLIMYPKRVQRFTKIRLRDGDIFLAYLVLYSIGRFIVESLRTDSLYIIGNPVDGGIRSAQLISIISIFIGSVWFIVRHRRPTRDDEALSVKVAASHRITAGAAADSELPEDEGQADSEELSEGEGELQDDAADELAAETKNEAIELASATGAIPPDEVEASSNAEKEPFEK